MQAYIFNIQQFSIHDGPGIRTTVFFQGCPLQCIWCHNPEGIPHHLESPGGKRKSRVQRYSIDELLKEILKDKMFYEESGGGATFSGGEPMMQTAFLVEILKQLRSMGIHTAVDTSGYAPLNIFKEVSGLTDLILFDLKIIDNKQHLLYTGTDNKQIHTNLKFLINKKIPFRVRIPLVNEMTAMDSNLKKIVKMLGENRGINIDLLSYHDLGSGKDEKFGIEKNKTKLSAPSEERLEEIREMFISNGFNVNLGG